VAFLLAYGFVLLEVDGIMARTVRLPKSQSFAGLEAAPRFGVKSLWTQAYCQQLRHVGRSSPADPTTPHQ
jgi:hypothetical protein